MLQSMGCKESDMTDQLNNNIYQNLGRREDLTQRKDPWIVTRCLMQIWLLALKMTKSDPWIEP